MTGGTIWCCHDDCLEVTDPLDGDVELLRHMARRHGERWADGVADRVCAREAAARSAAIRQFQVERGTDDPDGLRWALEASRDLAFTLAAAADCETEAQYHDDLAQMLVDRPDLMDFGNGALADEGHPSVQGRLRREAETARGRAEFIEQSTAFPSLPADVLARQAAALRQFAA